MKKHTLALVCAGHALQDGVYTSDTPMGLMRLYCVLSGSAEASSGAGVHHLREGNIYIFRQCSPTYTMTAHRFEHIFFDFHASFAMQNASLVEIAVSRSRLFETFAHIRDFADNGNGNAEMLTHFLEMILCHIDDIEKLPIIENPLITSALDRIHARCPAITTAILARELNLNECYFIRLFGRELGIAPMQYIRTCRLVMGIECLRSGMNVTQAALACGYQSATAFSSAIHSNFHCTPSSIRRR